MSRITVLLTILVAVILSCKKDESSSYVPMPNDTVEDYTITVDLSGYVQKGPFINGSTITVTELDSLLTPTGKNFTTQIADNRGTFSLKNTTLASSFVQLQAEGFYFDEVKGEKSAAQLTLFALADVSDANSVNVNLLSHQERNRVVYLMQEEEQEFQPAKQQAQQEILVAFGIVSDSIAYSEQLDISQDGDQNAILLAISAILQGNNSVAELSELVANLITDLREDGILNSEIIQTTLKEQAKSLDLPQIRKNLETRYKEMGVNASIPPFEQYIDSDGDGILNKDEDDTPEDFAFETQIDAAINDTITSNAIIITGLKEGGIAQVTTSANWLLINNEVTTDTLAEVENGDEVRIKIISSSQYAETVEASLTIGTLARTFQVITDDYVPDAFSFTPLTDVAVDSLYTSEKITISGLPYPANAKATNATIIKNGEVIKTDSVMVSNDDQIALQLLSSTEFSTASMANLDINGATADFKITTDDYTPDAFSIPAIQNATLDSPYTSEIITLSGIPHPTPLILDSGTLLVNGQIVANGEATVVNGDKISIQLHSGDDYSQESSGKLKIGSLNREFIVATPPNPWQRKAKYSDLPVDDPTGFAIGDKIYVGTGFVYENSTTDFFEYDPSSDIWTKKADFPGGRRYAAIGFSIAGKGYLGMGYAGENGDKFYEYNPESDAWRKLADFPGAARGDMVSFTIDGNGYVGLGSEDDSHTEFWRYDPLNDTWTQVNSFPHEIALTYASGFSAHGKGYLMPIYCDYSYKDCNYIWEYDPISDTWRQVATYPDNNYHFSIAFAIGEYAYVGSRSMDDNIHKSFWKYHLDSDTWKEIELGSYNFDNYSHFSCTTDRKAYRLQFVGGEGTYLYEFTPPQE